MVAIRPNRESESQIFHATTQIAISHQSSRTLSTSHSIIIAGDGRYYNAEAIPVICRILAANGVKSILVPNDGAIMTTPAVSAAIRANPDCRGAIVLTASHNPGGPGEDFGIKYNLEYGQPAGEDFTDEVSDSKLSRLRLKAMVIDV